MIKTATKLLQLPYEKSKIIVNDMLEAGLILHNGGDYKRAFRIGSNKYSGRMKSIYKRLAKMSREEFEMFCEQVSK